MKPWIKKLAKIGLDHPELRDEIREIVREAVSKKWWVGYLGDAKDKPVTPGEVFQESHSGWKPNKDGTWGSYVAVSGPYGGKPDAQRASKRAPKKAAYDGNADGKPIYDNDINHGYEEPLGGGTDVMRRLQNQFRQEQGLPERPASPEIPKQGAKSEKPEAAHLRKPYYSFTDGLVGFTDAIRGGTTSKDANLQKLVRQANAMLDRITRHINANYNWD